jgi:hypothetical protein
MSETRTSSGYSKLGLVCVSLFAILGACSAAISLLDTGGDDNDNINLNVDGAISTSTTWSLPKPMWAKTW